MTPQVEDALCEWVAGMAVGLIPLAVHFLAQFAMKAQGHIDGNWAIDWAFLAIATSATSIISVVNRYRKGSPEVVRGRAAPALIAATILFLVLAAVIYAIVATNNGAPVCGYLAFGLFIGAAFVSLYFELTLAARMAQTAATVKAVAI